MKAVRRSSRPVNNEFMNSSNESLSDKARMRASVRARLRAVSATERTEFAQGALSILRGRTEWKGARFVLGYLALKDELDLSSVLQVARAEGKTVALPRYVPEEGVYCAAVAGPDLSKYAEAAFG